MHNKDFYIKGTIEILKFVLICSIKELDHKIAEHELDDVLGKYNIFTFTNMLDENLNEKRVFKDASTFLNDGTGCEKFFLDILDTYNVDKEVVYISTLKYLIKHNHPIDVLEWPKDFLNDNLIKSLSSNIKYRL